MTVIARTTARHVKTTSIPSRASDAPDRTARREEQEQDEPGRDRRHDERQRDERLDEQPAAKAAAREQPRQRQPGGIINAVAPRAVRSVKRVICQMSMA